MVSCPTDLAAPLRRRRQQLRGRSAELPRLPPNGAAEGPMENTQKQMTAASVHFAGKTTYELAHVTLAGLEVPGGVDQRVERGGGYPQRVAALDLLETISHSPA